MLGYIRKAYTGAADVHLRLAWIAVPLLLTAAPAQDDTAAGEYEIKAAFLYNFAKFVEWPDGAFPAADSPIRLGVLGKDPFGEILDRTLKGRKVGGRGFQIERFDDVEKIKSCHIAFIPASCKDRMEAALESLKCRPVLAVGETPGFARSGGIINFFLQENKVRFEINPDAAARADLKISSKLLHLARVVREEKRP